MKEKFLTLYDATFADVYRYVYCRVSNKWDADDIVSEVYVKAFESFATVQGSVRPWLFTIARNTVADFFRTKGREQPNSFVETLVDQSAQVPRDQQAEMDCLVQTLQALDTEQRELIYLKYFATLKHSQVAEVLKTTEAAVKMRISRLLKQMKEMVQQCLT